MMSSFLIINNKKLVSLITILFAITNLSISSVGAACTSCLLSIPLRSHHQYQAGIAATSGATSHHYHPKPKHVFLRNRVKKNDASKMMLQFLAMNASYNIIYRIINDRFLEDIDIDTIGSKKIVALSSDSKNNEKENESDNDDEKSSTDEEKVTVTSSMVFTIGVYKNFISPLLPPACRFLPTCSQYGVQAIEQFGPSKGCILTAWRILRCSPFGGKGYDPPVWPPVSYTYSSY